MELPEAAVSRARRHRSGAPTRERGSRGTGADLTITPLVILSIVVPLMLTVVAAGLPLRDRLLVTRC